MSKSTNEAKSVKLHLVRGTEGAPARSAKRPRREATMPLREPGVVAQVRTAIRPENRLAAGVGAVLGGVIPTIGFIVGHYECAVSEAFTRPQPLLLLVLGCLVFSAKTCAKWCAAAFGGDWWKAVGWVVGVEGAMMASSNVYLSGILLAILVLMNAAATATTLALQDAPARSAA